MHRMGWSRQAFARRATERDEDVIVAWKDEQWPIKGRRQAHMRKSVAYLAIRTVDQLIVLVKNRLNHMRCRPALITAWPTRPAWTFVLRNLGHQASPGTARGLHDFASIGRLLGISWRVHDGLVVHGRSTRG
ncbi:hypothetical protein [Streptosporangium lutulentum]|uniref:hypothetical protein n=1 Tax=Streptosporangium lutulentum TaxID=1461250 RepID=UPI0036278EE4